MSRIPSVATGKWLTPRLERVARLRLDLGGMHLEAV